MDGYGSCFWWIASRNPPPCFAQPRGKRKPRRPSSSPHLYPGRANGGFLNAATFVPSRSGNTAVGGVRFIAQRPTGRFVFGSAGPPRFAAITGRGTRAGNASPRSWNDGGERRETRSGARDRGPSRPKGG